MKQNKQHAQALAEQAHYLYSQGKQAAAFEVYRAAQRAGYKPPAEEQRQREAIQAGALGFLVFILAAAAVAARAGFFF